MKMNKMNKRGASLSGWTEGAIGVMLLLLCVSIIVVGMNITYGRHEDPTFGMSSNATRASFEAYQGQLQTGLSGDSSTNALTGGINLLSSWGVAKSGFNLVSDFVTGVWVQNSVGLLQLGEAGIWLGWALRLVFVFSLIFILVRLIFKVNP